MSNTAQLDNDVGLSEFSPSVSRWRLFARDGFSHEMNRINTTRYVSAHERFKLLNCVTELFERFGPCSVVLLSHFDNATHFVTTGQSGYFSFEIRAEPGEVELLQCSGSCSRLSNDTDVLRNKQPLLGLEHQGIV